MMLVFGGIGFAAVAAVGGGWRCSRDWRRISLLRGRVWDIGRSRPGGSLLEKLGMPLVSASEELLGSLLA